VTVSTTGRLLLALDTSSAAVTVAVHDGSSVLAERSQLDARRHAELLAPTIVEVLAAAGIAPADLTGVVAGVGPGPFTGLRVGVVTARMLGAALGVPTFGVCSLDALAEAAVAMGQPVGTAFLVAADARRREVYWARYELLDGVPQRVDGPQVATPDAVPRHGLPVVGRGARLYADQLGSGCEPLEPSAGALATIAARALASDAGPTSPARRPLLAPDPLYLRRPDAVEPAGRKKVLQPGAR
jgi:tRNA threonylcarbamoyladenosine biosynthesis protein TsaB